METLIVGTFVLSILGTPLTPVYAEEPPPPPPPPVIEKKIDVVANNCYLYAKYLVPDLPRTADLIPNTTYPNVAGIVIVDYGKLPHYAKITSVVWEGVWIKESNFNKGQYSTRLLTWDYLTDHNARYWSPSDIVSRDTN